MIKFIFIYLFVIGNSQPTHNSVDHFICLPNSNGAKNNAHHLNDGSDHIYAVVNTSEGPQRARILRSSSNRDSSASAVSSSSIVSSCIHPNQQQSATGNGEHSSINKLAPNLIDLIPPPPSYPPPSSTNERSSMQVVSFAVQPSVQSVSGIQMNFGYYLSRGFNCIMSSLRDIWIVTILFNTRKVV